MVVHITEKQPGRITMRIRAEGPGGMLGDAIVEVRSGESAFGLTFEQWQAAEGPVEIDA